MSRFIESRENFLWSKDRNYKKQDKNDKKEDENTPTEIYFTTEDNYSMKRDFLFDNFKTKRDIITTTKRKKQLFIKYSSKNPVYVSGQKIIVHELECHYFKEALLSTHNKTICFNIIKTAFDNIKNDMRDCFNVLNFPFLTDLYKQKTNNIFNYQTPDIENYFDNICKLIAFKNSFDNDLAKLCHYYNNLEKYDKEFASLPYDLRNLIKKYI